MIYLWIFLGILVFLLGASYGFFCVACKRTDKAADLQTTLERPVYREYREKILTGLAEMEARPHETVTVRSYDGLKLVGEFYPHPEPRGTILMFHGWHGSPQSDFGSVMKAYYTKGLSLLLVHQRTQGASEGKYITFGIRESRDVHTWIQWHADRFGKEAPILLTGISMGASTVLMSAGTPYEANVRGIIADCGFTSPQQIISSVVRSRKLPAFLFVPFMSLWARLLAGFGFREYSTTEAVKNLKLPVFFAHGEADTFVPCHMTKVTYEACGSRDKTLLLVPNATHGAAYMVDHDNYEAQIAAFVNRCL